MISLQSLGCLRDEEAAAVYENLCDQPYLMLRVMEDILLGFEKFYTHRIHGTYIYIYISMLTFGWFLWQFLENVWKYSTHGP